MALSHILIATSGAVISGTVAGCSADHGAAPQCTELETRSCGADEGACVAGVQTCVEGAWSECAGAKGPSDEICNGQDDDCNGEVDETCCVPREWESIDVDSVATSLSVAADERGRAHIAYGFLGQEGLEKRYAQPSLGGHEDPVVVERVTVPGAPSIAVGPGGLHIAYALFLTFGLRYAFSDGGSVWDVEAIETDAPVDVVSLALDASENVHLVWSAEDTLRYTKLVGGERVLDEVIGPHIQGQARSPVVVDPEGGVHVVDHSEGLFYLYRDPNEGGWTKEKIDPAPAAGRWCVAIMPEASGGVHAVYDDEIAHELRYAMRDQEGDWEIEVVDFGPDVGGESCSAVRDEFGVLHVTYALFSGRLFYTTRSPRGTWTRTEMESGAGGQNAIAVDPFGGLHVAYGLSASPRADLRYAYHCPSHKETD